MKFTKSKKRIGKAAREDGLFYYEARHSDNGVSGDRIATVESGSVLFNYSCTLITEKELDFGDSDYMTYSEFKEQVKER